MIRFIQSNRIVRYLGSINLAIVLFVFLILAIGLGTIIESRHNADLAQRYIYSHWLFYCLGLLFSINIFTATLTRWPWKKKHAGFLITHFGMLTLLLGSYITYHFGIDGQMYIEEGEKSSHVWLKEKTLEVLMKDGQLSLGIPSTTTPFNKLELWMINRKIKPKFTVAESLPFVDSKSLNPSGFSFSIKSEFFNEIVDLTDSARSVDMGPAQFLWKESEEVLSLEDISRGAPLSSSEKYKNKDSARKLSEIKSLIKVESKVGQWQKEFDPDRDTHFSYKDVEIKVVKVLQKATISGQGLVEGEKFNPAVELLIKLGQRWHREVLFSRFPTFSLSPPETIPVKLTFESTSPDINYSHRLPSKSDGSDSNFMPPQAESERPQFIFFLRDDRPYIQFVKGNTASQVPLDQGEVTAPWMNIKLKLLRSPSQVDLTPKVVDLRPKSKDLPLSALRLTSDRESVWIGEGQYKSVNTEKERIDLYYGPKPLKLPFEIELHEFRKKEYLGTNTAQSFESRISTGKGSEFWIKMNEPFKSAGFTFYQSAYHELKPGKFVSVLSVNRDPGRWIKYLGSIITAMGVLVFIRTKKNKSKAGPA